MGEGLVRDGRPRPEAAIDWPSRASRAPPKVAMSVSRLFTTDPDRAVALRQSLAARPLLVVGLCAAWCGTCAEFRSGFATLATQRDDATFVWVDIEDDADLAGDIDVENFPTIAVFEQGRAVHFGVSLPQAGLVRRLLETLDGESRTVATEPAVADLPRRLGQLRSSDD